jgi:CheY-like chemotaxis protein
MASGARVLIIDDEPMVLETLKELLEFSGYSVSSASDGKKGIDTFLEERPEIVLTDMRMPHMPGCDVICALKRISPLTPVIALSGESDSEELAMRSGASATIAKPIQDPDLLVATIERVAERRRARDGI